MEALGGCQYGGWMTLGKRQSQKDSLQNPPQSPFNKGGRKIFPPLKGGGREDFENKDISY
jgi:hypothetical protein